MCVCFALVGASWGSSRCSAGGEPGPCDGVPKFAAAVGGFEAVYERTTRPYTVRLVGYDAGTRAWYQIQDGVITGVDGRGRWYTNQDHDPEVLFAAGTEIRFESPPTGREAMNLEQYIAPSLFVDEACRMEWGGVSKVRVVREEDGLVAVTVPLLVGSRVTAARGLPEGMIAQEVELTMWVDGRGVVRRVRRGAGKEPESLEYHPASLSRLPVVSSYRIASVEYTLRSVRWLGEDEVQKFEPEAVRARAISQDARSERKAAEIHGVGRTAPGSGPASGSQPGSQPGSAPGTAPGGGGAGRPGAGGSSTPHEMGSGSEGGGAGMSPEEIDDVVRRQRGLGLELAPRDEFRRWGRVLAVSGVVVTIIGVVVYVRGRRG